MSLSHVLGLFLAVLEQPDPVAVAHVIYQAFHPTALSPAVRASANTRVSSSHAHRSRTRLSISSDHRRCSTISQVLDSSSMHGVRTHAGATAAHIYRERERSRHTHTHTGQCTDRERSSQRPWRLMMIPLHATCMSLETALQSERSAHSDDCIQAAARWDDRFRST